MHRIQTIFTRNQLLHLPKCEFSNPVVNECLLLLKMRMAYRVLYTIESDCC